MFYCKHCNKKVYLQKSILLLLLTFFKFTFGFSQQQFYFNDIYSVRNYSQDDGMPQNSAKSAVFDKTGFLWIATEDGLTRFNGVEFKTIDIPLKKRLSCLFKLNGDTILVSDEDEKVCMIVNSAIVKAPVNDLFYYGAPFYNSNSIVDYLAKQPQDNWYHLNSGFPFTNKDSFAVMLNNGFEIYTKLGLANKRTIPDFIPKDLSKFNSYMVYLERKTNALIFYHPDGTTKEINLPFALKNSSKVVNDSYSNNCFLIHDSMLFSIKQDRNETFILTPIMNNFINIYSIHSIFYNDSSTIVALSKTNGIYVYRKNFLTPITVEKKENAAFYAQLLMPDNNTILTSDRNLFTKKGHVGKLSNFPVCISQSMLRTKQNEYWYFTYDKEPGKIDLYKSKYPGKEAMLVDVFKENPSLLFEDSKKNIWRITYQSIGFYSESNNFNKIAQGIGNMTSIVEDNRHIIWFGTEKGLYFYNPKNKKYTCLSFFGFKDINIRFILPDSTTNSLWLGTYSNGFYRIEFSNQKITKLPNDKNNILNTVHSIIEDSYHRFWITTNNGLFVATKKSLLLYCADSTQIPYYFYFDKSSGFLTNEFNGGCQPGYIRLPDGNISMPSINGLVWFNPDKIIIPFSKTPIFIDKIIINGEKYLTDSNIIETKSSNCNIEFEVSTITWSNQNNNYIEYAFSKKDETKQGVWIKLNTDYRIIFPFLNSGKYILHLRKRRSFEPDDYIYKSVIIDVPKSWYQIWYFYTAFVALATLLIYFIFSARNRYILRKNILLEKQITIATENLKEEKENLEQSNLVKSKLISTFNHDISTPLFYINSVLRSLAANKDVPDSIREPLHLVSNTSTELQLLTSDMLAWVEYQKDKSNFVLQHEWINIRKLIEEKWKIFEENAKKKSIHLSIDFDEAARIYTDSRIFSIIVYNLLSNSAKYLKSGSVKVSFLNGGSAKPDILSIHDESLEADGLPGNVNTEELSRGFGMGIMKDFSDLLGIRISFYKNSKKNMSVELIIPPSQEIRTDI